MFNQEQLDGMFRESAREAVAQATTESLEALKAELAEIQREQFEQLAPRRLEIKAPRKKKAVDVGMQHQQFDKLIKMLGLGLRVYIVGPAGSGKTHGCFAAAKALGQEAVAESFCVQSSKSEISGYMDAQGRAVLSKFRQAVENGWLYVADEIDSASANIVTVMNMVLASSPGTVVPFPDQMVTIHKDFKFVATANTFGRGASREYVGRNPLDAASLDRFVMLEWGYDNNLEDELARTKGIKTTWVSHVRAVRAACEELKIRQVVSPRATINGGLMLEYGDFTLEEVEEMVLFKGLDDKAVSKIKQKLPKTGEEVKSDKVNGTSFIDFIRHQTDRMVERTEWEDGDNSSNLKALVGATAFHKATNTWGVFWSIDSDGDPRSVWVSANEGATFDPSYQSNNPGRWQENNRFELIEKYAEDIYEAMHNTHADCQALVEYREWKERQGK